jgi:serine/threonine-protein kinase
MANGRSTLREFGKCRLDLDKKLLWANDEPVQLPLKAAELLCLLVENRGAVVTKDEIWRHVWNDAFVEETNLTHNIYLLRKVLKDLGEEQLIKTIPRRGYRFAGDVRELPTEDVILERHALTKTTIEFQGDNSEAPRSDIANNSAHRLTGAIFSPWGAVSVLATGALLVAGFFVARNVSTTTRASASDIRSLAVLPVRSFSEGENNEELRLRITDALITRLGHMDRTAVRPTSAILPFANSDQSSLEIGKQLQAEAVIDSRIQQEGERLRVTVQLIRVSNGEQIWSDQFDGKTNEILSLQDNISSKVARLLSADGPDVPVLAKRPTENSDAYEAYLDGRYHWTKRNEADLRQAIECFKKAIALDPNFSEAYTGLADTQNLLFNYNIDIRPEVVAEARQNLSRALELKPDSADALDTLGAIQMVYDWDWKAAEESLKAATVAEPNLSIAHMRYGSLLARLGRIPEALVESERGVELDPLSIVGVTNLGLVYFCKKDFADADVQFKKAIDLGDTVGASHWLFARSLWLEGKKDESLKELIRGIELDGNKPLAAKLTAKAKTGPPEDVIRLLLYEWRNDPPGTSAPSNAYLAASIGDRDKAMYWVERSIKEHHAWSTWFYSAPDYEALQDVPRFQEVLRQMKFIE